MTMKMMENAPRDGTKVLGVWPDGEGGVIEVTSWFENGRWRHAFAAPFDETDPMAPIGWHDRP